MALDMTRTDKQRKRLIGLLEELFQLDQPDLDFGFYKIMHAKAQTVSNFVQKDLLEIIKSAFGEADEAKIEEARLKYEQAVEQAKSFDAPDPEATEPVQKAKAAYDAAKDSGANEGEIYEHLYRFFERYYDKGDFMSRRYFARETGGKAAPYAVPYDGREVYLHWANRDQYYIKTSEYLTNFTFDIARHFTAEQRVTYNMPDSLKLHCRIVEAAEGEHNNNKTTDKTERFFLGFADQPTVMENGELVLQFEYRPDKEKSGTDAKWQEKRIDEAESAILHALTGIGEAESYNIVLRTEIGEDKTKRTLLRKYLNQYTKRNTTDYFIHKDLGSFLKRELDFYIKNEIMRLDDIESADAPHVQGYLDKIKVLRKIAGQLITFLAQLEEFQKKLWLKKKFVTETHYCITLDRVPEDLYAEIAANEAQRAEWVSLFAIDELDAYSEPLTVDFLKANPFLVLDTACFASDFKDALIAGIQDFDENLDGLLIHSENFQALGLMQRKNQEKIKCIYIDPPYNTGDDGFVYKDNYQHSSWASMIYDRLQLAKTIMEKDSWLFVSISEKEHARLLAVISEIFGDNVITTITVKMSHLSGMKMTHADKKPPKIKEYLVMVAYDKNASQWNPQYQKAKWFEIFDRYTSFLERDSTDPSNHNLWERKNLKAKAKECGIDIDNETAFENYCIQNSSNIFRTAVNDSTNIKNSPKDGKFYRVSTATGLTKYAYKGEEVLFAEKYLMSFDDELLPAKVVSDIWLDIGINNLHNEGGVQLENGKKPYKLVDRALQMGSISADHVMDFFAGSGTTAHAALRDKRKYTCVEQGTYFDNKLKARTCRSIYSNGWNLDKPTSRDGISHAFKYIRLESYEDTLNNLSFKHDLTRDQTLQSNDDFRRDYMLKYWLEFETKDSPSLLNIEQFDDPTGYKLKIKKPGSDEYEEKSVDLVESFNWLIGLHVDHLDMWRSYSASFKREPDPELPGDEATRLILDGRMEDSQDGKWLFRKVEGRVCRTPGDMTNTDRVLVIWRKLTGNLEEDNVMLDEWFKQYRLSTQDSEFDVIYVNGSNNLPNLRQDDEHWKVRLIEEAFHQQMWAEEV